jgi:hypothetical protein
MLACGCWRRRLWQRCRHYCPGLGFVVNIYPNTFQPHLTRGKNAPFFSTMPYGFCPEPVLVKMIVSR